MTSSDPAYLTRMAIEHNGKIGAAVIDQIRTIDKGRVINSLGKIAQTEIDNCKAIILDTFVKQPQHHV